MSKRSRVAAAAAQSTMVGSGSVMLRVDYDQAKHLAVNKVVLSDAVSAGGHLWRIECCPRGVKVDDKGQHLSIFVRHMNESKSIEAIFEAFLMDKDGKPSTTAAHRSSLLLFGPKGSKTGGMGWIKFAKWTDIEKNHVSEGCVMIVGTVTVMCDSPIAVPPSDIRKHLGTLLDSKDGVDVSFDVDGEAFSAHRAVLAARSPVFRAELFGSMAEATMSEIKLHDIAPSTFRVMLRFMYTDEFPGDDELGDSPSEMLLGLFAAADRYALDRLKKMCALKLCDTMSVDTAASTLECAEMHSCLELKEKCMDFFVTGKNFEMIALTADYMQLGLKFPSIIDELKVKFRA